MWRLVPVTGGRQGSKMADVTVKHVDEIETSRGGGFVKVRAGLGVTSFGLNLERLPPNYGDYPEHDHAGDGQEEVYFVIDGGATLQAGDESFELTPGTFARVGVGQPRKIVPGDEGVTVLAIGAMPGKAFEVSI
jgi:uncharacterized cupin superfamily protein